MYNHPNRGNWVPSTFHIVLKIALHIRNGNYSGGAEILIRMNARMEIPSRHMCDPLGTQRSGIPEMEMPSMMDFFGSDT